MRGTSCSNVKTKEAFNNALINGGCTSVKGQKNCYYFSDEGFKTLASRCREQDADAAFLFMGFLVVVGMAVVSFLKARKGGSKTSFV